LWTLLKFLSETEKEKRNLSTHYQKLYTINKKKKNQNWMKNKNSIYHSNMQNLGIYAPLSPFSKVK
jgi:hypothetical protein